VASASVPDVTQTDSTTTMPVALARRAEAEDDTRTWVPESRAQCDALQPAHHDIAHKTLCSVSASGGQTPAQYPARALSVSYT
jgi:hypothetical protein